LWGRAEGRGRKIFNQIFAEVKDNEWLNYYLLEI